MVDNSKLGVQALNLLKERSGKSSDGDGSGPKSYTGRKKRAVLIGINYTRNSRLRLQGCINDVDTIESIWSKMGLMKENTLILTDRVGGRDYSPTASNIRKAFEWLETDEPASSFDMDSYRWRKRKSDSKYQYVIHYSGHGTQVYDRDGDEDDGYDEAIVPLTPNLRGHTTITDDELYAKLRLLTRDQDVTFLTMDCCHSGTILDLGSSYDGYTVTTSKKRIDDQVYSFSGCLDHQTSADARIDGRAIGATTAAFNHVMNVQDGHNMTYGEIVYAMNSYRKDNIKHNQRHVFSSPTPESRHLKFIY